MSEFTCPECQTEAPAGTNEGSPYACPGCGNPVLPVVRRLPARAATPAPASRPAWKLALIAFVVLGAAYFGAYELLTAESKRERDRLFAKYGAEITTFVDRDPPHGGDAAALKDYLAAHEKFEDRRTYESRVSRIDTMFLALMLAFAAQSLFTAFVLVKTALRIRKASMTPAPRAPRPSRA